MDKNYRTPDKSKEFYNNSSKTDRVIEDKIDKN